MNDSAVTLSAASSPVRQWLRYDESLEPTVDAAFATFVERSHLRELFVLGFVLMLVAGGIAYSTHAANIVVVSVGYSALYLPVLVGLCRVPFKTWKIVLRGAADPVRSALYALGLAVVALAFETGLMFLLASLHVHSEERSLLDGGVALAVLAAVFMAPVCEEAFFQGWLQGYFEKKYSDKWGILTTTAFLMYHVPRAIFSYVRVFGLYTHAIVRRDTRSLGAPIIGHAFINAVLLVWLIVYFQLSHRPLNW